MKKTLVSILVPLCLLVLFTGSAAKGAGGRDPGARLLSPEELEELLAPIALYPDPLIAQLLPAATFTGQIEEAARLLERYGSSARIEEEDWDLSVKAVAHYPEVLFLMDREYPWTVTVGQAFVNQPQDVMGAIQRLREKAYRLGNLRSTREQQVMVEAGYLRIVPADPVYLYVPQYDPEIVYFGQADPAYPYLAFGPGFAIGAWLNRDCDWQGKRIYYHGWRDRGWVKRSRPHVEARNRTYVGRSARTIQVDRSVTRLDNSEFRERMRRGGDTRGAEAPEGTVYRARRGPQLRPPGATTTSPAPPQGAPRTNPPSTPQVTPSPHTEPAPASPAAPSSHRVSPGSRAR